MTLPRTKAEYEAAVRKKLNFFERLQEAASSNDERLDLIAQMIMEQIRLQAEGLVIRMPEAPTGEPPYSVATYQLDLAVPKSSPVCVELPGDLLTFYTDGSLTGIELQLDNRTYDWVPVAEFGNPYHYPAKFERFYLSWTAQPGRYLRVHIGREAGAEASVQLSFIAPQTSSLFTSGQTIVGLAEVVLAAGFNLRFGVAVKADDGNAGDIFVGNTGLTILTGYRLDAGQGLSMEVSDVNRVFLIANAPAQLVHFIGV